LAELLLRSALLKETLQQLCTVIGQHTARDLGLMVNLFMRKQVEHNLAAGIIRLTGDGHFQYSARGLIFLWGQFIKDMVRLC
jgi:hypothetical protein